MSRILLAVLSVLALALASCGGDDIGSKSAPEILKETFGPDKPVNSGRLDLRIAFDAKGLQDVQGPVKLALKGPFASSGKRQLPRFDFDLALDVAGQAVSAGAVSTGDKGWLKFAGQSFALPEDSFRQFRTLYERDQERAQKRDNPTFQALGVDPARWLAAPKKVGEENIGGAETVHVTSRVDVPAFLEDVNKLLGRAGATGAAAAAGAGDRVPTQLTPKQREQITRSIKGTSLDVYSGKDDGTLRRLNIQVRFDVPADARKDAGGLSTGSLGFDLVFAELNEKQDIAPPAGARPLTDLTGGATGATGATGADGGTAQGQATPQVEPDSAEGRYRSCVEAAGDSLAEVQKCAPLLNGG